MYLSLRLVFIFQAVRYSERSLTKCIGITIETRPDYCLKRHQSDMLKYGCTRLEIGVQSVYEDVARDTNRGHTVRAVCESFHLGKDSGFKIVSHMMPDLPNVGLERDIDQFIVSNHSMSSSFYQIPLPKEFFPVSKRINRALSLMQMGFLKELPTFFYFELSKIYFSEPLES